MTGVRLSADEGRALLVLARAAITQRLFSNGALADARRNVAITSSLAARRACFVTLTAAAPDGDRALRGCIGSTEAELPAHEAVVASALDAAFSDPRFAPLTAEELSDIAISVSMLTPRVPTPSAEAIVVGRDGVVLAFDGRQAIFLPEVATDQGWDRVTLLEQLARKAGLPAGAWKRSKLWVFETERFAENGSEAARIPRS